MTDVKKNACARIVTFIPVLAVMSVIFYFSSQTAEASTVTSGGIVDTVLGYIEKFFGDISESSFESVKHAVTFIVRKSAHFCEFGALGFFMYLHIRTFACKGVFLYSEAASVIYAVSDEIHQHFVAERAPRLTDVFVDSFGAVAGILLAYLLLLILTKVKIGRKNQ